MNRSTTSERPRGAYQFLKGAEGMKKSLREQPLDVGKFLERHDEFMRDVQYMWKQLDREETYYEDCDP